MNNNFKIIFKTDWFIICFLLYLFILVPQSLFAQLTVTGAGGATTIPTNGGTLQISVMDGPSAVTNSVWTVTELAGHITTKASINASGLLTASSNGNGVVRVKVSANSKQGVLDVSLSNQVLGISVNGTGNVSTITTFGQTLQMIATIGTSPASVTWSVTELDGSPTTKATIDSSSGLLTPNNNGEVLVYAENTARKSGNFKVTISGQNTASTNLVLSTVTGVAIVNVKKGQLQFTASDGSNVVSNAVWSVTDSTGAFTPKAIININSGLFTALENGKVTVKALKNGKIGELEITITGQIEQLKVKGDRGNSTINTESTLQMIATDLSDQNVDVSWDVKAEDGVSSTTLASINTSGLFTSKTTLGIVTVVAISTSDNSTKGTAKITIKNSAVNYTISIQLSPPLATGSTPKIDTPSGKLQLVANISPSTSIGFVWSLWQENSSSPNQRISSNIGRIENKGGYNEIAIIEAIRNGELIVRVALADNKLKFDELKITITNQVSTSTPVSIITISPSGNQAVIKKPKGVLQFQATVQPENASIKAVTWSIKTGNNLAEIDAANGILTAKGVVAGTVVVVATSMTSPVVSEEVDVLLQNISSEELVQSINVVNDSPETRILAGTEFRLRTIVNPTTTSNLTYTWKISDTNYVTAVGPPEDNKFIAVRPTGTKLLTLTAVANDSSKVESNAYVLVIDANPDTNVKIDVLGIFDQEISNVKILAYPNPVVNELHIELDKEQKLPYIICNQNGSTIDYGVLYKKENIYVGNLPQGVYFVKFDNENANYQFSFIKK